MKSLLKKFLHPGWVAAISIFVNKIYRGLTTAIVFKRYPVNKISFIHQVKSKPADLLQHGAIDLESVQSVVVREAFDTFLFYEQSEFFARVDHCIIEPKYGWPMTTNLELIYECFPYSNQKIVPVPSVFSLSNKRRMHLDRVISFRDIFDFGYWHFFADVLHKIYLLETFSVVDKQTPILISSHLASQAYFKFFAEDVAAFGGREIIVHDNFLVVAEQAFFIKPMPHKPEYYFRTSQLVQKWKGDLSKKRKVFLTRNPKRGRFISNMSEILPLLIKYDFELVDADELTLPQQIQLFSETSLLVAIHGAGLSNMMFRYPASLMLIEIFPWATGRFQIPPHYFLMSRILGFPYQALLGSHFHDKQTRSFSVNVDELNTLLLNETVKSSGV